MSTRASTGWTFDFARVRDVWGPASASRHAGRAYKIRGMDCAEEVAVLKQAVGPVACGGGQVGKAVEVIRRHARTGRQDAGWIYVSSIEESIPIETESV